MDDGRPIRIAAAGDLHASPAYRRKVAAVCIRRALEKAAGRAKEQA